MAWSPFASQRLSYAIHALCYMANKPLGERTTAPELAQWMKGPWPEISETYLADVIARLNRGGILRSHRGISGGYTLSKNPKVITLRQLVTLLEGESGEHCPLAPGGICPLEARCLIRKKLSSIEDQMLSMLTDVTLADLARRIDVTLIPGQKR